MTTKLSRWTFALALTSACLCAQEHPAPPQIVLGSDYLHYHPDVRHRLRALQLEDAGDHAGAYRAYLEAAKYSDKPSQARLAEMHWTGVGAAQDRATAYAWMDLAAERHYKVFIAFRESYWNSLDEAERERALTVGEKLYAEYGDDVAKPRLEHLLRKRRMKFTGSRTGFVSPDIEKILVPSASGWSRVPKDVVYQPRFWQADDYWEWQEELWSEPPTGVVEVAPLQRADGAPDEER